MTNYMDEKYLSASHWKEIRARGDKEIARRKTDCQNEISTAESKSTLPNLSCFITMFPLAMEAIANVHDYNRGPLLKADYLPSLLRHLFSIGSHPDHDAAVAWNAIARLEMKLQNLQSDKQSEEYQQSLRERAKSITG